MKLTLIALVIVAIPYLAQSAENKELERCYKQWGQAEETQIGNKKVTKWRTQEELWEECNQNVIKAAQSEKTTDKKLALALIIGRNTNHDWALPVYIDAANSDKEKKVCVNKDLSYSLFLGLSHPADDQRVKNGTDLLESCWPKIKDVINENLNLNQNSYARDHLCNFLKGKKAVPNNKKLVCKIDN